MKKVVVLSMIILIVLGLSTVCFGAPASNTVTTEQVQAMVNEQVSAAVEQVKTDLRAENEAKVEEKEDNSKGFGLIAAAISTGIGCIGAGIAVAVVASSAVGAISENPSLLGKTIIFAGLAEGIAIYGLIISIMILNKI